MKRKALHAATSIALLALCSLSAMAEESTAVHEISGNFSVTNDYRYRGLAQTRFQPALQGGVDYSHAPTGVYVGTWLSTIKWTKDAGGNGNLEWDVYAGKTGQLTDSLSYDVGGLYYYYPSNGLDPRANTFELYGKLGFGPAYVKYSQATTNLFGTANSKHSSYIDVGADIDMADGFVLNLHAGRQNVRNNSSATYVDYKVGVSKEFGSATISLAWVKANSDAYWTSNGKNLAKSGAVLSVTTTF